MLPLQLQLRYRKIFMEEGIKFFQQAFEVLPEVAHLTERLFEVLAGSFHRFTKLFLQALQIEALQQELILKVFHLRAVFRTLRLHEYLFEAPLTIADFLLIKLNFLKPAP